MVLKVLHGQLELLTGPMAFAFAAPATPQNRSTERRLRGTPPSLCHLSPHRASAKRWTLSREGVRLGRAPGARQLLEMNCEVHCIFVPYSCLMRSLGWTLRHACFSVFVHVELMERIVMVGKSKVVCVRGSGLDIMCSITSFVRFPRWDGDLHVQSTAVGGSSGMVDGTDVGGTSVPSTAASERRSSSSSSRLDPLGAQGQPVYPALYKDAIRWRPSQVGWRPSLLRTRSY